MHRLRYERTTALEGTVKRFELTLVGCALICSGACGGSSREQRASSRAATGGANAEAGAGITSNAGVGGKSSGAGGSSAGGGPVDGSGGTTGGGTADENGGTTGGNTTGGSGGELAVASGRGGASGKAGQGASATGGMSASTAGALSMNGGRAGQAASAGAAGATVMTPAEQRADIPGPTTPEQKPLVVGASYVFDGLSAYEVGITAAGEILLFGLSTTGVTFVAKYAEDLSPMWKQSPIVPTADSVIDSAQVGAVTFTAQGETLVTGYTPLPFAGETQHAVDDPFLVKLDADGNAAWAHQWGCPPTIGRGTAVAAAPDGSIYTAGTCEGGTLEGSVADDVGGPFVGRFSSDGTPVFLEQYPQPTGGNNAAKSSGLLVDPAGLAHVAYNAGSAFLRTIDATGALLDERRVTDGTLYLSEIGDDPSAAPPLPSKLAYAPDGSSIYSLAAFEQGQGTILGALQNFGPDGALHWYRGGAMPQDSPDSPPYMDWHGNFYWLSSLTVTSDSLYVTGIYANTYEPPPPMIPANPAFVARLDLQGQQIWFQELVLDENPMTPAPESPGIAGLVVRRDQNPLLILNGSGPLPGADAAHADARTYAVPLSKTDGSLL